MLPLVLLAAMVTEADQLGSERWVVRERAERRLAAWGPVAWPVLLSRASSDDAEVRSRVHRLLTPYRVMVLEADALAVLRGDRVPTVGDLYYDAQLRLRVHRLAVAEGCPEGWLRGLHPDRECQPWWGLAPQWSCWLGLEEARNYYWRTAPPPREK